MTMQWPRARAIWVLLLGSMVLPVSAQAASSEPTTKLPGEMLFLRRCAQCHLGQAPKAPSKTFLQLMPADAIAQAMISGIMQRQSAGLSNEQKRSIAHYLSGQSVEDAAQAQDPPACTAATPPAVAAPLPSWGVDARLESSRRLVR